jgi:hypothetical protein
MRQNEKRLRDLRDSVAFVGRMSDGLVRLGPFSLGIDGVLSWLPGVGDVYSVLAGAFIVLQGARAGVPAPSLLAATALLGVRTIAGSVPVAGAAFADLFTAHRWAAAIIVGAIDRKLGVSVDADPAWRPRATAAA